MSASRPDAGQRIAALTPEQRELLLRRLNERPAPAIALPREEPKLPAIPDGPYDPHRPWPLSDVQAVCWLGGTGLFDLGGSSPTVYVEYELAGIAAELVRRLNPVVDRAVARHPMLRTVISGDGMQRVLAKAPPFEVRIENLSLLADREIEHHLESTRESLRYARHRSDRWPLFEMVVHQLPGERLCFQARFDAILVDGIARTLLLDELVRGVLAERAGARRDDPPPLPVSYLDFVRATQGFRLTSTWQRCRAYWRQRLERLPSAPRLPLARDFGPRTVPRIVRRQVTVLDHRPWGALCRQAALRGITPTALGTAMVAEVLRSFSEEPCFTLALDESYCPPIHPQIRQVIGNFTALHLLAIEDARGSFEERARRLQDRLTTDIDHQHFFGGEALRELNRMRRAGGRATLPILFTSILTGTPAPATPAPATPAPAAGPAPPQDPPAAGELRQVDLMVTLPQVLLDWVLAEEPADRSFVLISQAVEELFPEGLVADLVAAYRDLAARIAADETAWSEERPLRFTGTAVLPPEAAIATGQPTLAARFAEQARLRPAAPALVTAERTLSYGELERWSGGMACRLRGLGVEPGSPVAVALGDGWQQVAAMLAVLRCGAACQPLAPALPPAELQHRLAQSGARLALTRAQRVDGLAWPAHVEPIALDEEQAPAAAGIRGELDGQEPDAPAWHLAGSDGHAVVVSHRDAAAAAAELGRLAELAPGDRLLGLSRPASELNLCEIFAALSAGAALVMPAAGERRPEAVAALAARERVTAWSSPPAVFEAALHCIERQGGRAAVAASTLDRILLHRGRIPAGLAARLHALAPGVQAVATWGTATAPIAAAGSVGATADGRVPLAAAAGWQLHVLDGDRLPRPTWVPGDLYLGRHPEREAGGEAARLAPAGERAMRLRGGRIALLGNDPPPPAEAVGYGADLGRVAAACERHPAVRHAIVSWRAGERRLIAWLLLRDGEAPAPPSIPADDELRDHLLATLPDHLVPAVFVRVAELPLDAEGHVDRSLLPPPAAGDRPADAAWPPLAAELAEEWEEVLGHRPAALADDFFELGGDSLLAARLLGRIGERFDLEQPLAGFLEQPTLGRLTTLVDRARQQRVASQAREQARSPVHRLRAGLAAVKARLLPPPTSPAYGMRLYLFLWFGQFVSALGTGLGTFALGVWVYRRTSSTTQYAMMGFVATCTALVVSPLAGVLADRWDRRRLILFADLGAALTTGLMALGLYTGQMRLWHVYIVVLLMVSLGAVQAPALTGSTSMLVSRRHLGRVGGMTQASAIAAGVIGPPLAGALVPKIGYHGVILIDVSTFLFAFLTLLGMRLPRQAAAQRQGRSFAGDLRFGWSYLQQRPGLLALLGLFAVTNFCLTIVQVLLTPLVLSFGSAADLGVVSSMAAAGGLLGSLALAAWGGPRSRVTGIFTFLLLQAPVLLLGALRPSVTLIAAAAFLFMTLNPFVGGLSQAIWQGKVAHQVQGRVFAMRGFIATSTAPLAFLLAGPLADRVFEPLLAPGAALAGTVGKLIGVGRGRGVALLFITLALFIVLAACFFLLHRRLRNVETELPDVTADAGQPAALPAVAAGEAQIA